MTLQNLAKIGQVNPHKATAEEVARLLTAVQRNLADAEVKQTEHCKVISLGAHNARGQSCS